MADVQQVEAAVGEDDALAGGATPIVAATLANMAGGIVVMKRGTATVSPAELAQALEAP